MTAASRNRPGPDADRLLVARLSGITQRHARWGAMDEAQKAEGAAALREVAGDRPDLLAEVAGIMLGTVDDKGPEHEARRRLSRSNASGPAPAWRRSRDGSRSAGSARPIPDARRFRALCAAQAGRDGSERVSGARARGWRDVGVCG
jgi:hypothetical protein